MINLCAIYIYIYIYVCSLASLSSNTTFTQLLPIKVLWDTFNKFSSPINLVPIFTFISYYKLH